MVGMTAIDRLQDREKTVTLQQYYSSRMMILDNDFTQFQFCGRLSQKYAVDNFCKIEAKLNWHRHNQANLTWNLWINFCAMNPQKHSGALLSYQTHLLVASASYKKLYLDSMAIMKVYGKPDLFATFTCNPNLPEINLELKPNKKPCNRPDLCVRVFRMKMKAKLDSKPQNFRTRCRRYSVHRISKAMSSSYAYVDHSSSRREATKHR